jgi:cytochrome c peroxidase
MVQVSHVLNSACVLVIALSALPAWAQEGAESLTPSLKLGKRLFLEKQFTNPESNFAASCRSCHLPEWAPEGKRAYADSDRYSLIPTNSEGRKRTTLRNVPTLMDVVGQERYGHDGRFESLEDAIAGELVSIHMGWLPEERKWALDHIYASVVYDAAVDDIAEGQTYVEQFKRAYDVDVEVMSSEEILETVVRCLTEYVSTLKSQHTSSYDAFAYMNRLPRAPTEGETPEDFGNASLARLMNLENRSSPKIHPGFNADAYTGFKIFMRTSGEPRTGNCVTCHTPPLFTDRAFYNTGVAQAEYDAAHGDGTFARITIPDSEATNRLADEFGPKLENGEQVNADLGYWNYAGPPGDVMLGAFKTPTLRNLKYTDPYMHNGKFATLDDVIAQKINACALVKSGDLRNGDRALTVMNITEADITPLSAFLATLNDLPVEEFEGHRRAGYSLPAIDK